MSELMKDILHTCGPTLHYDANPLPVNTIHEFTSFEDATFKIALSKCTTLFGRLVFYDTALSDFYFSLNYKDLGVSIFCTYKDINLRGYQIICISCHISSLTS